MAKITLIQTGDMEPACPECENENAMLTGVEEEFSGGNFFNVPAWKCRDCGFSVKQNKAEIVEKSGGSKMAKTDFDLVMGETPATSLTDHENKVFIFASGFVYCSACAESCRTYYDGIEGLKEVVNVVAGGSSWECENCGKVFNP